MSTRFEGPVRLEGAAQSTNTSDAIRVIHKRITPADLTTAGTAQSIGMPALPVNCILIGVATKLSQVFAGGAVSACTASVGDGSDHDRFLAARDVFTGASLGFARADPTDPDGDVATDVYPQPLASAVTPTIRVTSTTANVTALTTGVLDVWVSYIALQDPSIIA